MSASVCSVIRLGRFMPALLTRMSNGCLFACAPTRSRTAPASVTSSRHVGTVIRCWPVRHGHPPGPAVRVYAQCAVAAANASRRVGRAAITDMGTRLHQRAAAMRTSENAAPCLPPHPFLTSGVAQRPSSRKLGVRAPPWPVGLGSCATGRCRISAAHGPAPFRPQAPVRTTAPRRVCHTAAPAGWPARHGPQSSPCGTGASSIHPPGPRPRRSAPAGRCRS